MAAAAFSSLLGGSNAGRQESRGPGIPVAHVSRLYQYLKSLTLKGIHAVRADPPLKVDHFLNCHPFAPPLPEGGDDITIDGDL